MTGRSGNKSKQIRAMYASGVPVNQIAKRVGCSDAYVRVCARQRAAGRSVADNNYRAKALSVVGLDEIRRNGTREYRKQRRNGASCIEAQSARNKAIARTISRAARRATKLENAVPCEPP